MRLSGWLGLLGLSVAAVSGGSCAGSKGAAPPTNSVGLVDTKLVHEPCDEQSSGAQTEDVNGDGHWDVVRVSAGGREICRGVDLNFDQRVDVWSYTDASGQLRRRESDFDRDGRIDEIALYRAGVVFERQRATLLRGRLDTWQHWENGKLVRAERDSDGDSRLDQWWEYTTSKKPGCVLVHSDADRDGRPDPGSTLDLCAPEVAGRAEEDELGSAIGPVDTAPVEVTPPAPTGAGTGAAAAPVGTVQVPTANPAPAASAPRKADQ